MNNESAPSQGLREEELKTFYDAVMPILIRHKKRFTDKSGFYHDSFNEHDAMHDILAFLKSKTSTPDGSQGLREEEAMMPKLIGASWCKKCRDYADASCLVNHIEFISKDRIVLEKQQEKKEFILEGAARFNGEATATIVTGAQPPYVCIHIKQTQHAAPFNLFMKDEELRIFAINILESLGTSTPDGSQKEEQKKLITEIMNDDAKDGLYETGSQGLREAELKKAFEAGRDRIGGFWNDQIKNWKYQTFNDYKFSIATEALKK